MAMETVGTLPANALFRGTFTAEQLGIDFKEPEGVHYLQAPLDVYGTHLEDGERFDVVIDHPPLKAKELLGVLNTAAPQEREDSAFGVVADWRVVDEALRPKPKNREFNGVVYSQRLVDLHESLGFAWREFLASRKSFVNVLEDSEEPGFVRQYAAPEHALIRRSDLTSRVGHEVASRLRTISDLADILTRAGVENAEQIAYNAVAHQINRTRPSDSQISRRDTMDKRVESWHHSKKADLYSNLLSRFGASTRQKIEDQEIDFVYDSLKLEDGETYIYPRGLLGDTSLLERYEARTRVLRGRFAADVFTVPTAYGERDLFLPGTISCIAPAITIAPLISWRRDSSGKRELILDRHVARGGTHSIDGVMGAVALAYLSPEERIHWQKRMGLKEARNDQSMGAAQLPVLALMRRARLLQATVVQTAETVAA